MSLESVQEFLKEFETNETLHSKVVNATSAEDLATIITSSGFSFTSEEVQTVMEQVSDTEETEINEEELSAISGGATKSQKDKERQAKMERLAQVKALLDGLKAG